MTLDYAYVLDTSPDGSVVVGGSGRVVLAHNTATCAELWRKNMSSLILTLRIHGGVVVVPMSCFKTLVLDATTGQQVHALPSAGKDVRGICVFDGLTSDTICFVRSFFTL